MENLWRCFRAVLGGLVLLAGRALATDYYVDVVNGSDAAAGTSPATAWKTLTFAATAAAPGSTNTIHAAPGTYSAATGEVFPLEFRGQHVVGDAGPAATIVDGGGAFAVVQILNAPGAAVPASVASLGGLTLLNAAVCIDLLWSWSTVSTSFHDLVLQNAGTAGIHLASSTFQGSFATFHVQLTRVRVEGCPYGLASEGSSGNNTIDAVDCAFSNNSLRGVYLSVRVPVSATFTRCSFVGNGITGAYASVVMGLSTSQGFGDLTASFTDCLLASNQSGWVLDTFLFGRSTTTFTRCTIANNTSFGVTTAAVSGTVSPYSFDSTLVWGNGTDYSAPVAASLAFSQIGGANPLFRDPANRDFRVYFGSPVIDSGNPATPVGTLDLNEIARSVDGDLDASERSDIGCHEFRTLDIDFPGPIGTTLRLEIFGPAGGTSGMRLSRGPLVAPAPTPFGEFDLNPALNFLWFNFATAPGPGTVFARTVPPDPIFIGQTYSFQGLVTSGAAPSGAAWSNAVSLTITP